MDDELNSVMRIGFVNHEEGSWLLRQEHNNFDSIFSSFIDFLIFLIFNGFYSNEIYEVEDKPIMTMYDKETNHYNLLALN